MITRSVSLVAYSARSKQARANSHAATALVGSARWRFCAAAKISRARAAKLAGLTSASPPHTELLKPNPASVVTKKRRKTLRDTRRETRGIGGQSDLQLGIANMSRLFIILDQWL